MIITPEYWCPWLPTTCCSPLQNRSLNHLKTGLKISPKLAPQLASKFLLHISYIGSKCPFLVQKVLIGLKKQSNNP